MKRVFVFVLFLAAAGVWSQNLPTQPFPVKWKEVKGAGGYLAEVKDARGTIVVTQQVPAEQTSLVLALVPGPYLLNVTTLNRFLQPESDSGWAAFHVAAKSPPVVGGTAGAVLRLGQEGVLNLAVSGLAQDATVALKAPSGKLVALDAGAPADGTLALSLPALSEPGEWGIVLTNPPSQAATVTGKLRVVGADTALDQRGFMFIYPTIFGPAIDFRNQTSGTGFGVSEAVAVELEKTGPTKDLLGSYGTKQFWGNLFFYPGLALSYAGVGLPGVLLATTISGSAYEDLSGAVAQYNGPAAGSVTFELRQFGYRLRMDDETFGPHDEKLLGILGARPEIETLVARYRKTSATAATLGWTGTAFFATGGLLALSGAGRGGLNGVELVVLGLGSAIVGLGCWTGGSFVGASAEADLVQAVKGYNQTR